MKNESILDIDGSKRNLVKRKTDLKGKSLIQPKDEEILKTKYNKFKDTTLKNNAKYTKNFEELDKLQQMIALNEENNNIKKLILDIKSKNITPLNHSYSDIDLKENSIILDENSKI